jgi:hypothetical protein
MRPAVHWSLYGLLACFQNMPTEVSGAKILILHPLYAGSHELVLRYTLGIISKMTKQTFFSKSANRNPQIRKLIPLPQISANFLGVPVCKSQIRMYAIFEGRKSMHLRTCGSVKSAYHKILAPQIIIPQSATFLEGRKANKLFKSANLRICDLWNLFVDHPPWYNITLHLQLMCAKLITF